jgi:biopolymer transport protein ExbB/TolQ
VSVIEWLAAGGLVTLIGLTGGLLIQGRAVKQAVLGYEGRGGMMDTLETVRRDLNEVRQQLITMDRELRAEITESRHALRNEFQEKLSEVELALGERIDGIEERVRELELRRTA